MTQQSLCFCNNMAKLLLLFITLLIPLHLQVNSQYFSSEQTILLSFKAHWANPPSLNSWTSNSSSCDWPEIECTSGVVTGLNLARKGVSGTIPSSICQLTNLVTIKMSANNISGRVPVCLHNCSNLEKLDLSLNALSGKIPGELFRMKRLQHLYLQGNKLYGEIPTPIEAPSLEFLDLSSNRLNGSIPDDMKNINSLIQLDLSMNLFIGAIPMGLFSMNKLNTLLLGHNKLSGQLPSQSVFITLQVLNLSQNHFNGTIPKDFGDLTYLHSLDLSNNQLSGDIIENLLHLRSMSILRLCSNRFSGKVPYELVKQDFSENCLDKSNLCSNNRTEVLSRCPSRLCSDYGFQGFHMCTSKNDKYNRHYFITIAESVGCGVVFFALLYYLARKCWPKKNETFAERFNKIWPSSISLKDKTEWKMMPFQRLKFNETDILPNLTDENLIGNGGSGKVYRVLVNQTGYAVAVKSISNARKSNDRLEKEFLAEIQTLGTIRHYNIVKLLCYISGSNTKLLLYQYFENRSLDQWLHGKRRETQSVGNSSVTNLDWPMRLHIAIGAAQGLCYMHHDCYPPIIHRDVKSSNILLDSEFNAKIADFGLAKLLTKNGDTETASAVAGTFGYIAPGTYFTYSNIFNAMIGSRKRTE